jgi:hypothetical protein
VCSVRESCRSGSLAGPVKAGATGVSPREASLETPEESSPSQEPAGFQDPQTARTLSPGSDAAGSREGLGAQLFSLVPWPPCLPQTGP